MESPNLAEWRSRVSPGRLAGPTPPRAACHHGIVSGHAPIPAGTAGAHVANRRTFTGKGKGGAKGDRRRAECNGAEGGAKRSCRDPNPCITPTARRPLPVAQRRRNIGRTPRIGAPAEDLSGVVDGARRFVVCSQNTIPVAAGDARGLPAEPREVGPTLDFARRSKTAEAVASSGDRLKRASGDLRHPLAPALDVSAHALERTREPVADGQRAKVARRWCVGEDRLRTARRRVPPARNAAAFRGGAAGRDIGPDLYRAKRPRRRRQELRVATPADDGARSQPRTRRMRASSAVSTPSATTSVFSWWQALTSELTSSRFMREWWMSRTSDISSLATSGTSFTSHDRLVCAILESHGLPTEAPFIRPSRGPPESDLWVLWW